MAPNQRSISSTKTDSCRVSLRSLTGNSGYRSSEAAYKDDFIDPYIGKIYTSRTTEVFSMGVQYLANPADAAMFAAKDPEMFAFVTGYLRLPETVGTKTRKAVHADARNTVAEAADLAETARQKVLDWLAASVALENRPEEWEAITAAAERGVWWVRDLLMHYIGKRKATYVGSYKGKILLSGVFKSLTGRWQKGFLIVHYDDANYPGAVAIHDDGKSGELAALRLTEFPVPAGITEVRNRYFFLPNAAALAKSTQALIDLYNKHNPTLCRSPVACAKRRWPPPAPPDRLR